MTSPIRNQRGIALITTMIMLVLAFAVVAIVLRLTTQQTKLTGLEQGYTTALGAAKAGTDLFINTVENCSPTHSCVPGFGTDNVTACLNYKLFNSTANWSGAAACQGGNPTSLDPTDSPDITLQLGQYKVNIKVINNYLSLPNPSGSPPCEEGCYYYTVAASAQGAKDQADIQYVYRFNQ